MPILGVKAPSVRIESLNKINPGETVDLTALATVDTRHNGEAFFYWYADQGTFTLNPSYPDYSTVTYTAPNTPGDVTITAQVGDTLGYVGTDRFTITVTGATPGRGNPPVLQQCTYRVSPKDWQDVYHATYRLTVEENSDGVPVGHLSIQPTTGNMRWESTGSVRTFVDGTAVNVYEDANLTDVIGKTESYHKGYGNIDIYFNAGFSENKTIIIKQFEQLYGNWQVSWQLKASCPGPGKHSNGTPDLVVDTAEADPSTQLEPGASTFTRARVSNIGDGPADASALACYLSTNSSWDSSDTLLYHKQFSTIYDGSNAFTEQRVTIPASQPSGDYYLIFRADDQEAVAESNEGNNEKSIRIEVRTGPDLTISNAAISPSNVSQGQEITLTSIVVNSGDTGTLASSRIGYYLSDDATWDSTDTVLGTSSFGSLLPGQSQTFTRTFTLPADIRTGQHYIIFYADYANKVTESRKDNNQAAVSMPIVSAENITILSPNATTSWSYNRPHTIQWQSKTNSGTVRIDLYKKLSFSSTIAASAANTGTFTWNVPELLKADDYWIKITSNTYSSAYADSEHFTITRPATLTIVSPNNGELFGFGTVRNINWETSFSLSGTVNIDLYKSGAPYRAIARNVPTVSTSTNSYAWTVPSDLAEGTDYQIKITHTSDSATTDMSDGFFTITDASTEEPLAKDDATVTDADVAVLIDVLTNDNPPQSETLDVISVSNPAHGTALLNADDTVTYTPESGFTGSDFFTYTVSSPSRGNGSATVYITVNGAVSCDPWELPPDVLDLARDDAGNIFVVGAFESSITLGTDTPVTLVAPAGMPGMYIAKYTASGTLLWAREAIGGTSVLRCKVAVDTTGNLYLAGDYYSTLKFYDGNALVATLTSEPGSACEIFLAKYSPTGELTWAQSAGGQRDDHGESLTVDSASNHLYIGGNFDGVLNLGGGASSTTLNSVDDNADLFLAQYTLDGILMWAKQIDGGAGSVFALASKGTDAVLATGYYEDSITLNGPPPVTLSGGGGERQVFVAEFSANDGQVRWAQKATGTSDCVSRAIATDNSGQVYIAGDFSQNCDFYDAETIFSTLTSFGRNDIFMIKYQSDGTLGWLRQGGGTSDDLAQDVTFDLDSNPIFIGTCAQFPAAFTTGGAGTIAASDTSCAGMYDSAGSFQGFIEPGTDLVLAEESTGRPAIIGWENKVMPCGSLLVNIPPAAANDTVSTLENQAVNIPVLDNDTDPEGNSLSVFEVTQGQYGSVAIASDGLSVTYTPDGGFIGTDSFDYTIDDGSGGTASATVTITVTSSSTELTVTDILPIDSSAVALNQVFTFTFNEPITAGSCYNSINLEDSSSASAAVNTTISGNILTVEPSAVLAAGTDYLLTVPSCALAGTIGGNTLSADFTHAFTTEGGSASVVFTDIAVGSDHAIALDSDGNVWAWGKNDYGQAGDSSLTDQLTPIQVQGLSSITEIAAGRYYNLALDSFGSIWAWGDNRDGQLGNGTKTSSAVPVPVSGLTNVIAIAAGSFHSIALKENGTVWTWGTNGSYQLGHGSGGSTDEVIPGQVANLFNVTDIAGGYNFTTVLKQNGTVWSWGRNDRGQLGTGDTVNRTVPTAALLTANVISIHGSLNSRAFAITSDNSIWGWGYNGGFGAVGNGNGWDQPVPVKILDNALDLSGGNEHTVALGGDGTLWVWGRNWEGEYGTGSTSYSTTPVAAADLADITAVAAGGNFTVVLKANGTIWCWGSNSNGKLGNNSTENALSPVQVMMQ
ncbi:MAG: Ig-like domain-containing protein [Candidatus Electrothrix aestuarii]|uniref:Ig-like domain-containing protein n=1 Tax=Candidatus Electrothrix aestuarii TaxID=3062594 RepID=A0AAU8LQQ1_9BACT|nr:Ig-like domain-containing protein [Candidatus Electrothrix aestuarii]